MLNRFAAKLGYPTNPIWQEIADTLVIPVIPSSGLSSSTRTARSRDSVMPPESLMAFFYGYSHNPEVDAATYRFFIEHDLEHYLALPMLSGFLGVIPARLGDRALARAYFDHGNLPFFTEPITHERRGRDHGWSLPARAGRRHHRLHHRARQPHGGQPGSCWD